MDRTSISPDGTHACAHGRATPHTGVLRVPIGRDRRSVSPRATRPVAGVAAEHATQRRLRLRTHVSRYQVLLILGALQLLLLGTVAWALTSPVFTVDALEITGTHDARIISSIRAMSLTGCNVFRCDIPAIVAHVEELPAVADAHVSVAFPRTLALSVVLRQPALVWSTPGGTAIIASDGMVLQAGNVSHVDARLPVIQDQTDAAFGGKAPQSGTRLSPTDAEMAIQLHQQLGTVARDTWTIQFTADRGFVARSSSGMTAIFGTPWDAAQSVTSQPSPEKLAATPDAATLQRGVVSQVAQVRAILANLSRSGTSASLIDVRWGLHPYYR